MAALNPYLIFNGNCREAMQFYHSILGGDLQLMPFHEAPGVAVTAETKDRVMHAFLRRGELVLMASDSMPEHKTVTGDNVHLSLQCDSAHEIELLYAKLAAGGEANMPVADAFWGARFGMLTDRFGVRWMLNFEKK